MADHALISGPFNWETAGGRPAMMSARNLFIMSVVKPETGLCSHFAPALVTRSPKAFIASPSAPADHCEITLMRGSACAYPLVPPIAQAKLMTSNDLFSMMPPVDG